MSDSPPFAELLAALTLTLYALLFVVLVVRHKRRTCSNWRLYCTYVVERLYLGLGFHWRANRRCPFPEHGAALVYGNHRSPMDPMLIWNQIHTAGPSGRIRPVRFLTAREIVEMSGIVGWICRTMETIPVDRNGKDMASVREVLRLLKEDTLIGLFPEGGLNKGEGLRQANTGIAFLALSTDVPVFPVYIENSPRGETMVQPFYNFQRVRIHYGDPVDLSAYRGQKKTREMLTEVTTLLMERLAELGGDFYDKDRYEPPDL